MSLHLYYILPSQLLALASSPPRQQVPAARRTGHCRNTMLVALGLINGKYNVICIINFDILERKYKISVIVILFKLSSTAAAGAGGGDASCSASFGESGVRGRCELATRLASQGLGSGPGTSSSYGAVWRGERMGTAEPIIITKSDFLETIFGSLPRPDASLGLIIINKTKGGVRADQGFPIWRAAADPTYRSPALRNQNT